MIYSEKNMNPEATETLAKERRNQMLNLKNPRVKELYYSIRNSIEPELKPGADLDQLTENILIHTLQFAYTDQLSGLSNRERLKIEVEAAMVVARKLNLPLSVLYMDGRGFKEINDTLGHFAGDLVIEAVGEAMQASIKRSTDITIFPNQEETEIDDEPNIEVARDHGDEFAAVLLGTDLVGANVVAKRMQSEITKNVGLKNPELQQTIGHPFDITVGIAQYDPTIHQTSKELIKAADANLTAIRNQMGQSRRS